MIKYACRSHVYIHRVRVEMVLFGLGTIITAETIMSRGSLSTYIFIFYITVLYTEF